MIAVKVYIRGVGNNVMMFSRVPSVGEFVGTHGFRGKVTEVEHYPFDVQKTIGASIPVAAITAELEDPTE